MNLRDFDEATICTIQGLPKYNTSQFTKLEALNLLEQGLRLRLEAFASAAAKFIDEVRAESPVFLGSCSVVPQIMDFFEQEVLSECVAAIEAEEKNALDAVYVREVA